jgi:precorrin-3B synthase
MSDLTHLTGDAALFTRRGACPALSAPMQTGDGLLVRLNPVSAGVSPGDLIALCDAAKRHGNGIVEITARGSLQIRGLTSSSASALACDIDTLGIAVQTGVPVQTGVLSGLDPDEIADSSGLAGRIRKNLRTSGLEGKLGPKVSVVVDGGGRSELDNVAGDVRLTAVGGGRWRVAIAGDAATAVALGVFADDVAAEVALALLRAVADKGIAARGRDLGIEEISEALRSTLPPSVLPDISPTRREIGSVSDIAHFSPAGDWRNPRSQPISPPVGEMAGRPEGGAKEREVTQVGGAQERQRTLITLTPLTDSRTALGIVLPFGSTDAEALKVFAANAQALGAKDLLFAPKRTLVALCPSPAAAQTLQQTAQSLGFITSPTDPRLNISACPGAPACASAHLPARELAAAIAASTLLDGSLDLHVSGCAKGCAHPAVADLTLVGTANDAGIVVGGTARQVPLAYTSPDRAEHALKRVAKLVAKERRGGESSASVLARLGRETIAEAFGKR